LLRLTIKSLPKSAITAVFPVQSFDSRPQVIDIPASPLLSRARDGKNRPHWKGASAIHMAQIQARLGRSGSEIVCVDTLCPPNTDVTLCAI
jgi:hypothetical protein